MADREGFEPSVRFHVHTLSKRARSTTPPPVHPSNRTGSGRAEGGLYNDTTTKSKPFRQAFFVTI